jgi:hypothetical protein
MIRDRLPELINDAEAAGTDRRGGLAAGVETRSRQKEA